MYGISTKQHTAQYRSTGLTTPLYAGIEVGLGFKAQDREDGDGGIERRSTVYHPHHDSISLTVISESENT